MEIRKTLAAVPRKSFSTEGPSMTKQSHKAECDINNILAHYTKTGLITHVKDNGRYLNVPSGLEYHDAMNIVLKAQALFDGLPAEIRKQVDNDPAKFLDFVSDEENVEIMAKHGLLVRKEEAPAAPADASGDSEGDPE